MPKGVLGLLHRWRDEAVRAGRTITRIALAFEAGRDGFWLARWLAARGVEAHVIHASSLAVSREHRRAKTDRLDTELLKRGFLGWLRGERGHCSMARVPTIAEEGAKRPNRERNCLVAPLLARGLYSSPRLWIPHVTLAEGLNEAERAAARDALLPSFTPIEATADRLELVRFPPTHVEWGAALSDASLKAII